MSARASVEAMGAPIPRTAWRPCAEACEGNVREKSGGARCYWTVTTMP